MTDQASHDRLQVVITLSRILPLRSGREVDPQRVLLRPPVGQPRRVRQHATWGDLFKLWIVLYENVGGVVAQRSVQVKHALFTQLHHAVGEDGLTHRLGAEDRARVYRDRG